MVQSGLAGAVGKRLHRGDTKPVNAANMDDPSWVSRISSFFKERRQESGEIEDTVKI